MIDFGWGDYDNAYGVIKSNGSWTLENFVTSVAEVYDKFKIQHSQINLIVDLRHSAVPPTSIISIDSRVFIGRPLILRRVIVINKTLLWKRLYEAITQNRLDHSIDIHFVESVDKAYKLLLTADIAS